THNKQPPTFPTRRSSDLFGKEVSQNGAKEFLHLQGQITLHRLAWAYLKANGEDEGNTASTVERTIIELLNDKYTRSDPGFVKARSEEHTSELQSRENLVC